MPGAKTTSARGQILGAIRTSLAPDRSRSGRTETQAQADVQTRLREHREQLIPARANQPRPELLAMFRGFLEGQSATVLDAAMPDDIPRLIGDYLRNTNMPARLRMGGDELLNDLDWSGEPTLERDGGIAVDGDRVGLSHALAGAAETGTLFLVSGADNPVTINFLPDTHIIVIREIDIVGSYEAAWGKIRERYGHTQLPRTVNMISGPSRTADIAGTLVRGAHGPKDLCVIVVKGDH